MNKLANLLRKYHFIEMLIIAIYAENSASKTFLL